MAKNSSRVIPVPHSPDHVLKVIITPEFQQANFLGQGNKSAELREISRDGDKLVLEATVEEYKKGVKGIDKTRTETSWTTYKWDLGRRFCEWTYRSPHKKVRSWGTIRVDPDGENTRLSEDFNIEIKIPIVGRGIEKIVISETEKYWPKYERLVADQCDAAAE